MLAGAHTSTWGMYKDSPHEGFGWGRYSRSIAVSGIAAALWQLAAGFDLATAAGRVVLFGLTYVTERGLVELWKGYLREEDQSKYFIPMQLHVMGRVVKDRRVRWSVARPASSRSCSRSRGGSTPCSARGSPSTRSWPCSSWAAWAAGSRPSAAPSRTRRSRASRPSSSSAARWSPSLWALVVALFTTEYLFVALCGLGYTVATIETYKTFFFPNKPRGKFAGKPILFPHLVSWRYRFAPLYAAIWLAVIVNLGLALREPRRGLLAADPAPAVLEATPDARATS